MNFTVHFILFSNGEPFNTTKQKIIQTIPLMFSGSFKIHSFDLNSIQNKKWFPEINNLKRFPEIIQRDHTFNAWKPFICWDVFQEMDNQDLLYYIDASRHFQIGFEQNLDFIFQLIKTNEKYKKGIHGLITNCVRNNTYSNRRLPCISDKNLYTKIGISYKKYFNACHVLNSNFILVKDLVNNSFLQEWKQLCSTEFITKNHTIDQAIFSLLVIKYNLNSFTVDNTIWAKDIILDFHIGLKDHNLIPKILNHEIDNIEKFMINIQ